MIRTALIILLLATANIACAAPDSVLYYNRHWQPVEKDTASYYRIYHTVDGSTFRTEDYLMNGTPYRTGFRTSLENESYLYRTGHFVFYDSAGIKAREGNYVHGCRNGEWRYYYRDGRSLTRSETFNMDTVIGHSYYYDSSTGNVVYEYEYQDGKSIRDWSYRHGDTTYEETSRKGKTSVETTYDKHGNVLSVKKYRSGRIIAHTCYDSEGDKIPCDTTAADTSAYREQMPVVGYDYNEFVATHVHYPERARLKNIKGRVLVKFIIDEDGTVTNVHVIKGIGGGCDEEAARVVSLFPAWSSPGVQNGKVVRVYFTLPIVFRLTRS